MSSSHVLIEALSLAYPGGPLVLGGIDLELRPGEFVAVTGPSGCGKSTLLRLLAGLLAPTGGRVSVDGREPSDPSLGTALVFQDPTLLPWRDALGNAALLPRMRGLPEAECRGRAEAALRRMRLEGCGHKYPRQLSGGQRMRVSLARALAASPRLLLLDEPFGALDELTREHLGEELLALRSTDPWTAVFVTHSVAEAVFLADRVVVIGRQPARVVQVVENRFEGPRNAALRSSEAYLRQVARLTAVLRGGEEGAA